MKIIKKVVDLQNELFKVKKNSCSIGLVPTMGALHEGHVSLVQKSIEDNDVTVVSIFLNPTQFNDKSDYDRYPKSLEKDCTMLENCGVDYVFAPSISDIYPTEDSRQFVFPPYTSTMEGEKRPGHFNGVCQVVSRLFYITKPNKAYFGKKDWQQIMVVKALVKYLELNIEIIECPIIREKDGLAKSSRNALLTDEERKVAPNIYKTLCESKKMISSKTPKQVLEWVVKEINTNDKLSVEYFSIVDGCNLDNISSWKDSKYIVGCITVNCGEKPIRLIDHIEYIN